MTHVHADVALYEAMQASLLVGFVFIAMLPSEHMPEALLRKSPGLLCRSRPLPT
jgi:hypothetical protein